MAGEPVYSSQPSGHPGGFVVEIWFMEDIRMEHVAQKAAELLARQGMNQPFPGQATS